MTVMQELFQLFTENDVGCCILLCSFGLLLVVLFLVIPISLKMWDKKGLYHDDGTETGDVEDVES